MNAHVNETYGNNKYVINFMQSSFSNEIIPKNFLVEIYSKIIKKESDSLVYRQPGGDEDLRKLIAKYYLNNVNKANKILITSGAQQGLYILLKNLQKKLHKKITIAIEEYSYIGFAEIIESLKFNVIRIPINNDGLDLDFFNKILKKKSIDILYVIPDLQNPTGIIYKKSNRKKIMELQKQYEFSIVEDICYRDFIPDNQRTQLIANNIKNGYIVGSFSKTISPAFRIGWLYTNNDFFSLLMLKREVDLFSSFINQRVVMIFFRDFYREYTNILRRYVEIKNKYFYYLLIKNKINHFYKINVNNLGIHFWLEKLKGKNLPIINFQKNGLIVGHGIFFHEKNNNHLRFCTSHLTIDELRKSVTLLVPLLTNNNIKSINTNTDNFIHLLYKVKISAILIKLKILEIKKIIRLKYNLYL